MTDQAKLEPARAHHETRTWIRELLAQRGTMTTQEIATATGLKMKAALRKLDDMETALMVKKVASRRPGNRWSLRCWKGESTP